MPLPHLSLPHSHATMSSRPQPAARRDDSGRNRFLEGGAVVACGAALILQLVAIHQQSLVGDAAYHLLAGHQALRYGRNVLNLEHPPLVKLVAAAPLLAEAPLAPPTTVDDALTASQRVYEDPDRLRRVQHRARGLLLAVFGLPFLLAAFALGRRAGGTRCGVVLALMLACSLSVLPFLSILQTDTAVSLGFVLTLLAALRYGERPCPGRAVGIGLGLGFALVCKFSAVFLGPPVLLTLVLARGARLLARLAHGALIGTTAWLLVTAAYAGANYDYQSTTGRDTIRRYCRNEALIVEDRMRPYEAPLLHLEQIAPYMAQWLTGLLGIRIQNAIGVYPTYAFGEVSSQGRWWYFPALLLIKTPLLVLAATFAAFLGCLLRGWSGRAPPRQPAAEGFSRAARWVLITAVGTYFLAALGSNYNLGIRHLMPILPLLYLPAACWVARHGRRVALVVALLLLEAVILTPRWMAATNTWWLGAANPTRFALSAGDMEYHQSFIQLAKEAETRGSQPLYVLYPLLREAELRAYLPTASLARPDMPLEPGGWYAVNIIVEQFMPAIPRATPETLRDAAGLQALAARWTPYWQAVAAGEDHGYAAATFHLYRQPLAAAPVVETGLP